MGVPADEGFGVGEVGEGVRADLEEVRAEGGEGVVVLGDLGDGGEFGEAGGGDPGVVVDGKGLAVAVADEGGAIVDFAGEGLAEELSFGEVGEPVAEGGLVGGGVEAEVVGRGEGGGSEGEGLGTGGEGELAGCDGGAEDGGRFAMDVDAAAEDGGGFGHVEEGGAVGRGGGPVGF